MHFKLEYFRSNSIDKKKTTFSIVKMSQNPKFIAFDQIEAN